MKPKNIYYLCTVETFCDFLLWQELFYQISGSIINIPYKSYITR